MNIRINLIEQLLMRLTSKLELRLVIDFLFG
jgi:hypothetical protein